MGILVNILFFGLLAIYLLGLLGRFLLRYLLRKQGQSATGGANPFFGSYTWGGGAPSSGASRGSTRRNRPEGKVTVERAESATDKRVKSNVGDYVDYEEM